MAAAPFRAGGAGVAPVHAEEGLASAASAASSAVAFSIPEATLSYTLPDLIFIKFADIIGYTGPDKIKKSKEIISKFNEGDGPYFTRLYGELPLITKLNLIAKSNLIRDDGSILNSVVSSPLGKGSYGTVYKNFGDYAYKFIKLSNYGSVFFQKEVRQIFLEVFIQLLLFSDDKMGSAVCGIYAMYRTSNFEIILKIEYIETKFSSKLKSAVTFEELVPIFTRIYEVLSYFRHKYNFHHGDLHPENIMFKDGTIKIIDFGHSCVNINSINFSTLANKTCESADILLLIAYMYETSALSAAVKSKLLMLLKPAKYLYEIPGENIWHNFYYNNLIKSDEGRMLLKDYDSEFLTKLESVAAAEKAAVAAEEKRVAAQKQKADKNADIIRKKNLAEAEFNKEYNIAWTIENINDEIDKLQDYYDLDKEDGRLVVVQLKETYNYAINLKKFLTDEGPDEKFPVEETTSYLESGKDLFKTRAKYYTPPIVIMKLIENFTLEKKHEIFLEHYPKFVKDAMSALFSDNKMVNEKIISLIGGYRKHRNTKRYRQKRRKTVRR